MSAKRALLIGNGRTGLPLPPLQATEGDIAALAKVLGDPEIGGFEEVTPLLDATSPQIRREIARFLSRRVYDDLLLLYFTCHGVLDERGALHLVVADTEPDYLSATALPAAFVTSEMDRCQSRRQILMLDCCYSGAFERGSKGGPTTVPSSTFEGNGIGRIVLTASDSTQLAWEPEAGLSDPISQAPMSLFTRHVIEGLESGEADVNRDGLITVDELYDYVYKKVVTENPRQTPGKWSYGQRGELELARNRGWQPSVAELPGELALALENNIARVREGAVRELGQLFLSRNPLLAEAARAAAKRALEDDSRRVAAVAAEVLAATPEPVERGVKTPEAPSPPGLALGVPPPTAISTPSRPHTALDIERAERRRPIRQTKSSWEAVSATQSGSKQSERPGLLSYWIWLGLAIVAIGFFTVVLSNKARYEKNPKVEKQLVAIPEAPTSTGAGLMATESSTGGAPPTSLPKEAKQAGAESWPLIFADNFESMKSLAPWTNWTNSAGAAPSAGTLLASIKPDTKDGEGSDWVLSQANPTGDFYLKVEVKRRGGPSSASAGLVFGRSKSEYYLFEMSDQSYRLLTWTGMTYEFTRAWTKSFATRPGQINSISVLSTGSKRILFINDQKVDQITEAPSSSSYFGLRIDAETAELVTFAFDNFELRGRPEITAAPGK